jgi:hypothetical protein
LEGAFGFGLGLEVFPRFANFLNTRCELIRRAWQTVKMVESTKEMPDLLNTLVKIQIEETNKSSLD